MNEQASQVACRVCLKPLDATAVTCVYCKLQCHETCAKPQDLVSLIRGRSLLEDDAGRSLFQASDLPVLEEFADMRRDATPSPPASDSARFSCFLCEQVSVNQARLEKVELSLSRLDRLSNKLESMDESINTSSQTLTTIETKLNSLEKRTRPLIAMSWAYVGALCFVVLVTGLLVWLGWAQSPEVSIEYNVGEIIGGVLVGVGAAAAGTAYAFRTLRGE